jgi:hypothetical protein
MPQSTRNKNELIANKYGQERPRLQTRKDKKRGSPNECSKEWESSDDVYEPSHGNVAHATPTLHINCSQVGFVKLNNLFHTLTH